MMRELELFQELVVPLVSAQCSFVFLLYFVIAGKQLTKQSRFYILFLAGFTLFILSRAAMHFLSGDLFWIVNYLRVPILFSLAAPSLGIATALHCRFNVQMKTRWAWVVLGVVLSALHTVLKDIGRDTGGYLVELGWGDLSWAHHPILADGLTQTAVQAIGGLLLFVIPCAFLLAKELRGEKRTNPLAFIVGALLFGILFVIGTCAQIWSLLYLGSLACAGFWGWAIFSHLCEMRDASAEMMKQHLEPSVIPKAVDTAVQDERIVELIDRARTFILNNFQNELTVDEIAKNLHVSSSHFSRLFKQQLGKTVKQYLTEVRIEQAKLLLVKKNVTDTAFAVGFNDSNYFSTVFKKHTGQTPTQFRSEQHAAD